MQVMGGTIKARAQQGQVRHVFRFVAGGEAMSLAGAAAVFTLRTMAGARVAVVSSHLGALTLDREGIGRCVAILDAAVLRRLKVARYRFDLTLVLDPDTLSVRGTFDYLGDGNV